jgi:hypothetical protein
MHNSCDRYRWYHLFISEDRSNVDKSMAVYEEAPERGKHSLCGECPYFKLCKPDIKAVIPKADCLTCGFMNIDYIKQTASCDKGLKFNGRCNSHVYRPDFISFDQPIHWHDDKGSLEYSDFSNGLNPANDDKEHFFSWQLEEVFNNVD